MQTLVALPDSETIRAGIIDYGGFTNRCHDYTNINTNMSDVAVSRRTIESES